MIQEQEAHSLHLRHDTAVVKYQAIEDIYTKAEQKQVRCMALYNNTYCCHCHCV